jgi:hypothetical protein
VRGALLDYSPRKEWVEYRFMFPYYSIILFGGAARITGIMRGGETRQSSVIEYQRDLLPRAITIYVIASPYPTPIF